MIRPEVLASEPPRPVVVPELRRVGHVPGGRDR